MLISHLINNNYVAAVDENGREVIVKGVGIGYGAHKNSQIPREKIEKIYEIHDGRTISALKELMQNIPENHFAICGDIIDYAKNKLRTELNPNLYATLTDHINYALIRFSKGTQVNNPMINDIRIFYPEEFEIGRYAVALVNKKFHVAFEEDEAGFIALHIVNAEANTIMNTTIKVTRLVRAALEIIEGFFDLTIEEDTPSYRRLVTNLQLIVSNIFRDKKDQPKADGFIHTVSASYPQEFACSKEISRYIQENHHYSLDDDELAYLAVSISRVRTRNV